MTNQSGEEERGRSCLPAQPIRQSAGEKATDLSGLPGSGPARGLSGIAARRTLETGGEPTASQPPAGAPRSPHPDPVLAARGWQRCGWHDPGIYVRGPGRDAAQEAVPEREAG